MISHRHCTIHSLPIDIICKNHEEFITVCFKCFQDRNMKEKKLIGVRLNAEALNVFACFTQFVEKKLEEWVETVNRSGFDGIFERKNVRGVSTLPRDQWNKMKDIAAEVISNYRNLIRTNKTVVVESKSNDIFYHPQFLKDLYSLIIDSWEVSSQMILDNYIHRISEELHKSLTFAMGIRYHLINEINNEKKKMINEVHDQILVNIPRVELNGKEERNSLQLIHEDEQFVDLMELPKIAQVDSFQELIEHIESNKSIEGGRKLARLRTKLKNSKIMNQNQYKTLQDNYKNNLEELQKIKEQNQSLKKENQCLNIEKGTIKEEHDLLRKKYDKLLQDKKQRFTSGKKQSQNIDPNSQLVESIVQLEVELNNSRYDVSILADCLNECMRSKNVGPSFRENLKEKMLRLITVQIDNL